MPAESARAPRITLNSEKFDADLAAAVQQVRDEEDEIITDRLLAMTPEERAVERARAMDALAYELCVVMCLDSLPTCAAEAN